MKQKLRQILQSDFFRKKTLQKLLLLIPVVIVLLVFMLYRAAGAYRAQDDLYTYIGEVKAVYPAGTKLQRTDEATYIKNAGGQSIGSRPLYSDKDNRIVLPVPYAWVTMNVGKATMCRLETFSTVDISTGSVKLQDEKMVREGATGFLFDGDGTYVFLEPATVDWGEGSCEAPAMSFVTVQYGESMNLHVYGKDTATLVSTNGNEVKASFQNGASIELGTHKLWLPNGTWMLLFNKPELLPRMDEMK